MFISHESKLTLLVTVTRIGPHFIIDEASVTTQASPCLCSSHIESNYLLWHLLMMPVGKKNQLGLECVHSFLKFDLRFACFGACNDQSFLSDLCHIKATPWLFWNIVFKLIKMFIPFSQKAFLERVVIRGEKNVLQMNMICLDTIINGGSEK